MIDCIYGANCICKQCDLACPAHAEIKYWLDRCGIDIENNVYRTDASTLDSVRHIVESSTNRLNSMRVKDTLKASDLFCYCAICLYGRGNAFNGGVYNLNFHKYIDEIKKSWTNRYESEWLEYARLWNLSSDYLIISHLDYINFNDFESQTLLTLFQERNKSNKTTFVLLPKGIKLVGKGQFYKYLLDKLEEVEIK